MCRPEWRRALVQAQRLADFARLRRVRDRIDREYARPLDVAALARDANMAAGQLSREFRAAYGQSPYAYLMARRIERAAALLRRGDLGVTEVCRAVGCASLGTFTTRFTELVGMPPGAFRRRPAGAADAADAAAATAGRPAPAAGPAIILDGMPAWVARRVARPVRNREAPAAGQRLA
ncbi:AraC family transcriptional regulator [Kitasatospora sp. NPDC001603]|uniref:AraC family transcriptional regulator n=1 Tax=Kitasatospora sp. NPDC001603 TaxID=3154388 RepID=UPI0033237C14